ncbi:MAG: hypothetical protein ACOC1Z_01110 [Cyanobacteriota bacterium]
MEVAFILKVFLLSAIISTFIKLLAPYFELNPSGSLAIAIVFMPAVILGMVLWRRFLQAE